MPRYSRPKIPSSTERAISVFSNSTKVAIVGYLAKSGPATRGEVAKGLEIGVPTAQNNLVLLEAEGVLMADPPASEERNGSESGTPSTPMRWPDATPSWVGHLASTKTNLRTSGASESQPQARHPLARECRPLTAGWG